MGLDYNCVVYVGADVTTKIKSLQWENEDLDDTVERLNYDYHLDKNQFKLQFVWPVAEDREMVILGKRLAKSNEGLANECVDPTIIKKSLEYLATLFEVNDLPVERAERTGLFLISGYS